MGMPKEKSPRIDGVMVEILQIGWEFMQDDCLQMVQSFWTKKELIGKDSRGVIKLIPKNDMKHLLKNWRPITLLTMTYKIIAKIIAVRLKRMLPGIIDSQQTGFAAGRNIIDNILSLRLGQEWAAVTNQQAIFDRKRRAARMPISSTPFRNDNATIDEGAKRRGEGRKHSGLNIGGGQSLLHQLFVDDTGICITAEERQFDNLKEVIREFEMASRASLNLQKSIVMQLTSGSPPAWLDQTGCEVASLGKSFKYLGVVTSSPIDERAVTVQKMMKKLKHWSNRLLSWPAKTIL
ncbi:hypothetical protein R1sor_012062 [Riccia sorocarpa]|uniref:Reverse transcriptase domain-containing protein n=1 Tax=Riccia sorocarpa TaxID=122646 RepID=A0ABD3I3L7_9MARC